jgi:uncharacterized protein (DUF2141 family)
MNRFSMFLLAVSLLPFTSTAADDVNLTITVKGVHSATGAVYLAVYDEAGFGKPELAKARQRADAAKGDLTFVIRNLPAGKYAVASYHDENGNGKLDTNAYGMPTEGYGFSNGAQAGSSGPPTFAESAFDFDGKTAKTIAFSLNY